MDSFVRSSDEKTAEQSTVLSPLDQIMPRVYTRLILCFPTQTSSAEEQASIFSALEKGLQQTLTEIPFLGGAIADDKDDSGKVHITPGPGVSLRSKILTDDTNLSYPKLKDAHFPLSALDGEVLAPVGMMPSESNPPVMAGQINFVHGGILLVLGIHHSATDAAGFGTVLRTWAKNTRSSFIDHGPSGSDSPELISLEPNALDRGPLMQAPKENSVDPERKIKDHPQYKLYPSPPLPAPSDEKDAPPPAPFTLPPMTTTIFHFSASKLAALKHTASPPSSYISTNDALSALLWRSITRARSLLAISTETPTPSSMLGFAVDGRRRLAPPLPQSYLGNVNIYASARQPIPTLLDPTTLSATASAIRAAITDLDDSRVRDVIALVNSLPVVTDLQPGFNSFLGRDLALTSWREMGTVGLDWGSGIGAVESVRIPKAAFDGLCIVLPALAEGGLEVLVGLESGAMERLKGDEVFTEWAEARCV